MSLADDLRKRYRTMRHGSPVWHQFHWFGRVKKVFLDKVKGEINENKTGLLLSLPSCFSKSSSSDCSRSSWVPIARQSLDFTLSQFAYRLYTNAAKKRIVQPLLAFLLLNFAWCVDTRTHKISLHKSKSHLQHQSASTLSEIPQFPEHKIAYRLDWILSRGVLRMLLSPWPPFFPHNKSGRRNHWTLWQCTHR